MSARIGFHIGPFYFSQRLGRTQAQKRAAAKARAQRQAERERAIREAHRQEAVTTVEAVLEEHRQQEQAELVEFRRQREASLDAELEELRRQQADHDSRTRRGVIAECRMDPLNGGSFTFRAEGMEMTVNLDANAAMHFLSLKNGDIVQVTFAPGKTGLEEFWQLSRANGAKPRSAVALTAADMERLGLASKVSPSPGS
jgi:hypothetical protein